MRTLKSLLLLFAVASVVVLSCSSNSPVVSPIAMTIASPTILPTATFTYTPAPTDTPTITPTNIPMPTISKTRTNLSPELYLDENSLPENLEELDYPEYFYFGNDLGNGFVYHFGDEEWIVAQPWTRIIPSKEADTTHYIQGELRQHFVQVWKDGKMIYAFPVGGVIHEPHQLLRYEDHWIFSFGNIYDNQMRIVQDGILLNDLHNYDTAFSPFLLDGKLFFFFKRGNELGISFHNEEILLPYTNISYGAICCEGGGVGRLNPRSSNTKVGFYVQRGDSDYQYVEIGLR